jgi:hypothetical protein
MTNENNINAEYVAGLEKRLDEMEKELNDFRKYKRFYVPHLGTRVRLANEWTFSLFCEHRNSSLWEVVSNEKMTCELIRNQKVIKVTLPEGCILSVDRLYVRRGAKDFDSVTFRTIKGSCGNQKKLEKNRFWAKLADVRNMIVEVLEDE